MIIKAKVRVEGTERYYQGRPFQTVCSADEDRDAFDKAHWRERMHTNAEGRVIIPPTAFTFSLIAAAKKLSKAVPGKNRQTYTRYFESGIRVIEPLVLPVKAQDVRCEALFIPADGKPGGGKRVYRRFPYVEKWGGEVEFINVDPGIIQRDIFEETGRYAGRVVGIGVHRPERRGWHGTFTFDVLTWEEFEENLGDEEEEQREA